MARTTIVHVTVLLLALLAVQGPMACQADTTTTSTNKIKTVIVLMEENRSFDHMLGFIRRANQSYPANGLTGHESNPYNTSDPSGKRVYVQDEAPYVSPWDPCHSHSCTDEQIYSSSALKPTTSPSMQGFAQNEIELGHSDPANIMNMFTPDRVPIISTLAQEFALFDAWFCSVPGPTNPNRRFLHSATACGSLDDADYDKYGFNCSTVYDRLDSLGLDWAIHYYDWSPLFKPFTAFYEAAAAGTLPPYTFLTPRMFPTATHPANDQHPDHDVRLGEALMKSVYEAVRSSPQWNESLLLITYDEHGGFYDHVSPPTHNVPNPDGLNASTFNFTRMGVRVPTIAISPWINKGIVEHAPTKSNAPTPSSQYGASSVPATLKRIFGWEDFLTKRDAWAAPFDHLWASRTTPRSDCPTHLPPVPGLGDVHVDSTSNAVMTQRASVESQKELNDLQTEFLGMVNSCVPQADKVPAFERQGEAGEFMRRVMDEFSLYDEETTVPIDLAALDVQ